MSGPIKILSILAAIIIIVVILVSFQNKKRSRPKTISDIKDKLNESENPLTDLIVGNPDAPAPSIYGDQPVEQDDLGDWHISPGTCDFRESGIINWQTIKDMPQEEKDLLYDQIGSCNLTNIPLYQP